MNANAWDQTASTAPFIVVKLQISSDGVTPQKTANSFLRAIMGSVDKLFAPHLKLTMALPGAPPFIIGLYKGKESSDDVVLEAFVQDMKSLEPSLDFEVRLEEGGPDVYATISVYLADDKERRILTGTVSHCGLLSCPRCQVVGTKQMSEWQLQHLTDGELEKVTNGTYFPDLDAEPRVDADWKKFRTQKVLPSEVKIAS